jgi:hypothetical protein
MAAIGPTFTIEIDERSLKEADRVLRAIPRGLPKAMNRALNRTVTFTRARFARVIAKDLKIKVGDAKKQITVTRPPMSRKFFVSNYTSMAIDLEPVQTERGVTHLRALGSKERELKRHAFIATGKKRGRQVWLRARYYLGRTVYIDWHGRHMEAIYAIRGGLSPYRVLMSAKNRPRFFEIQKETGDKLAKEIDNQVGEQLRRWSNRGSFRR